jgi:dihydrodipicolinate synthase/N-acetylneuraminate lyase
MTHIYGIVPPLTTPFDASEELDEGLLRAQVRHLVQEAGVHGLAVGGSTGEGHTLSIGELRRAVGATIEEAQGRVPVIAGIIVDSTRQAVERGRALADLLLELDGHGLVMSAVDALLYPSFCLGAHGSIAAILTAVPELCVQLWDAMQADDHVAGLDLHAKLLRVWNAIAGDNLPANVKCAIELQGRVAGLPRAPMGVTSEAQKAAIRAALQAAGLETYADSGTCSARAACR